MEGVVFNKSISKILACPNGKTGNYSIPSSVTEIGNYTFNHCKLLTSITIPEAVIKIGNYAFQNCDGLNSIYAYPPKPLYYYDFPSINNITVYVPANSLEAYKANYYWSKCMNIVAM